MIVSGEREVFKDAGKVKRHKAGIETVGPPFPAQPLFPGPCSQSLHTLELIVVLSDFWE